jgi:16S rRNA (guanine(527)-N(7))-methyltransferase RsmG
LGSEALPAGGIGPNEAPRLHDRHIADSLLFATHLGDPDSAWDLGSGVGLPGIPLAIIMPRTRFVLVDRSGRRIDLVKRAIRVLDLGNVEALHRDIDELEGSVPAIVSRASLSPEVLRRVCSRHLAPGGVAVVGGSWSTPPVHPGWETVETDALDRPVWLLMMRRA